MSYVNNGSLRSARVDGRRLIAVEELDRFTEQLITQSH